MVVIVTDESVIKERFFDDYPQFYSTSQTGAWQNRLNQRWRACIEWNKEAVRDKRILDLASHDGRWSFAAMKAGATSVIGIEARDYLVQSATQNMRRYGIPDGSFRFVAGDVFEQLDKIDSGVDTVLCLGFFYHVANHVLLLSKVSRLKPQYLILDTILHPDPAPTIVLYEEAPEAEANGALVGSDRIGVEIPHCIISGAPSKVALELMLSNFSWSFSYYDWHQAGIRSWDNITDYQEGRRVTLRVDCRRTFSK
jgi:hypothetical protein